jgi:hypothetical protein
VVLVLVHRFWNHLEIERKIDMEYDAHQARAQKQFQFQRPRATSTLGDSAERANQTASPVSFSLMGTFRTSGMRHGRCDSMPGMPSPILFDKEAGLLALMHAKPPMPLAGQNASAEADPGSGS